MSEKRNSLMVDRFVNENTSMTDLAVEHGITRERVRQILWKSGLRRADGFKALSKGARRDAATRARWDRRCEYKYGCDFETVRKVTGRDRFIGLRSHPLLKKYEDHRNTASRHGIPWQLTLVQYAAVIGDNLLKISLRQTGLVLGRKDKAGPYSAENCELVTLSENSFATGGLEKAIQKNMAQRRTAIEKTASLKNSGFSNAKICKVMKCCMSTVTQRVSRAKQMGLLHD